MKVFKVTDEIYVARVLTGIHYMHSCLDDTALIDEHLPLVPTLKAIKRETIDDYKHKDTEREAELYALMTNTIHSKTVSFGYLREVAISAFNANDGITSYDLANLLSRRLMYTKTGLFSYQLQEIINQTFDVDRVIGRKELDDFCEAVKSGALFR